MDITHDNVCSSMLSCFYSHLLSTRRPISSLLIEMLLEEKVFDMKQVYLVKDQILQICKCAQLVHIHTCMEL